MNRNYLINEVEKFSKQNHLQPAKVYETIGELYKDDFGVNIVMEMENKGLHDITQYLEDKGPGFIERYIHYLNELSVILNNAKKCK